MKTYQSSGKSGKDYGSCQKSLLDEAFCTLIYLVNEIVFFIWEKSGNFDSDVCGSHDFFC